MFNVTEDQMSLGRTLRLYCWNVDFLHRRFRVHRPIYAVYQKPIYRRSL